MSRFGWVGVRGWGWLLVGVVVGVLGCGAAGARAQPAAGSVVVPRVSGGVLGVYDRMRAAGLRVSIPGGVWFDSLAPPRVRRVLPAAGRRVRRGSVVRLYLARHMGRRAIPRGRLPAYVVPQLVGGVVSAAYRWVRGKRLDFRAYLGPLRAGGARGLFANYRVTRQWPAAGARLRLGRGKRPAKGSGGFRLTPLSVWGSQLAPVAPCTPPPGYKVIASSPQAVITSHEYQSDNGPTIGWYGCLRALGRMWRLTSANKNGDGYDTWLGQAALAGRFAALSFFYEDKYDECSSYVDLYDLGTRTGGQVYQTTACPYSGMPSGIDSLAVNSSGFAAWRATSLPVSPRALNDVSCPSVSLCVAADNEGNVITSTNPTGGPAAWTLTHVDKNNSINAVACPSTSLCVATDNAGDVITSTNPTGGAAAWTLTHVDKNNIIWAVACPSTSLCVATDDAGHVITSTNPTGGPAAWTLTHDDDFNFIGPVTCPSTSLCVGAGDIGDVITSTNPTGGAAAWTLTQVEKINNMGAVTCASTSLCVATDDVGDVITSTNPTGGAAAWTLTHDVDNTFGIGAVTCPSTSLCVAAGGIGDVITSTNPTGGAAAWNVTFNTGIFVDILAVTCPSTSLCVATDNAGDVITSTNPAARRAGASSWSSDLIDADPSCVATPCPLDELYAHDNDGTRLIDSTPRGGIANVKLSGALLTWTHGGTPQQVTLH